MTDGLYKFLSYGMFTCCTLCILVIADIIFYKATGLLGPTVFMGIFVGVAYINLKAFKRI